MHFQRIAIVGVGLIGGSFALAARRAGIADTIAGVDRKDILDEALRRGVIDDIETSFESQEISDADLVYLSAPVGAILRFLHAHGKHLKPGAIVTDAGSTKREICRAAREALAPGVHFVGGHPMAGSEKTGLEHADAELFRGAPYALIVEDRVNTTPLNAIKEVVCKFEARPVEFTSADHDRIVARVSHTPQMLATALAIAVARTCSEEAPAAAGTGFTEMTRLADSRWSVWEDICRTNAGEISAALDEAMTEIEAIRIALSNGDFEQMRDKFKEANEILSRFRDDRAKA